MGVCKFYFSDRNGCELNHKLNGCSAGGTGSGIAENGEYMCNVGSADFNMWRDRKGRMARTEISEQTWSEGRGYDSNKITIDDFDGHTAVLVKFWSPKSEYIEYFWLIGPDGCKAIADQNDRKGRAG